MICVIELFIDSRKVKVKEGKSILQAAKCLGVEIPTLCHYQGKTKESACLVCGVWDLHAERYLPACSTLCQEGMQLESSSERVASFRKNVIELILSEHRGDCEAPCKLVCPQRWDIPRFMHLVEVTDGPVEFPFNPSICETCGGKCEKVCRRQKLDGPVKIRKLLAEYGQECDERGEVPKDSQYVHRDSKVTADELAQLDGDNEKTACLQCACRAKDDCQLRQLAKDLGAKRTTYQTDKKEPLSIEAAGLLVFERHKCIKCGRCLRLGDELKAADGPTLAFRGRKTSIIPPIGSDFEKAFEGFEQEFVEVCPAGAICWRERR